MPQNALPAVLAAALLAVLLGACSPRPPVERGPRALLATSVGPALKALWDAHGGIAAWERVGEASYLYEAEISGGPFEAPIRVGPVRVRFVPGDWDSIEVGEGGSSRRVDLREPAADPAECAIRWSRLFFHPPFALADPVWEFRRVVTAAGADDPWTLSVAPAGAPGPAGGMLIPVDPATGLPRGIWYRSACRPADSLLEAVVLRREEVDGIRVPVETVHLMGDRADPRYPWESPGVGREPGAGGSVVIRERISAIELVHREGAAEPAREAAP